MPLFIPLEKQGIIVSFDNTPISQKFKKCYINNNSHRFENKLLYKDER